MAILSDGSAAINFFVPQGGWEQRETASTWLVVHIFAPGWLAVYDDEDFVPKYRMWRLELKGSP